MHPEERTGSQHPWVKYRGSKTLQISSFPLALHLSWAPGDGKKEILCFHLFKIQPLGCFSCCVTRSTFSYKSSGQSGFPSTGKCKALPYQTHISAPEESLGNWLLWSLWVIVSTGVWITGADAGCRRRSLTAEQWRVLARRYFSLFSKPWCSPCAFLLPGGLCRTKNSFGSRG